MSTTPYNIPCTSKYTPYFNGTCMPSSNCLGATLTEICANKNYVCCITDPDSVITYAENKYITLRQYLSLLGDTPRNRRLYNLFSRSMAEASIATCHQAAAYFAQIRGESRNLAYFEEATETSSSFDYDLSIGNNDRGDGEKYRGRGALLLRGKGVYLNATSQINTISKYNLVLSPEAAAFPSVAFRVASWMWTKNAFVITTNSSAKRGSLNNIADGTFHNFTLITHAFTGNVQHLKNRTFFYEEIVREIKCKGIKRGRGIACEMSASMPYGYAVPICLIDLKKSYCGCEGQFILQSCPYGLNSAGKCRNPSIVKCCYEKCDASLDLVIIMDSSGSIGATNFPKGLNFIKKIVSDLEIGENDTRVGIINYSTGATIVTRLDSIYNKTRLLQVISSMPYQAGSTNTQAALALANNTLLQEANGMRPIEKGVPKVVVVITDGGSNVQPQLTIPNAQSIKNRGFSIVSVGIGNSLNQNELNQIASNKDDVYNVDDYDKIFEIIESLLKTACEQPATAILEKPIEGKVSQGSYRYYRLQISNQTSDETNTLTRFSIAVGDIKGSTKLFYSFEDENPKDNTDFLNSNAQPNSNGNYIEQRSLNVSQIIKETIYQISRPSDKDTLYISLKGLSNENEFQIYIYNRTVNSGQIRYTKTTAYLNALIVIIFFVLIF